MAHPRAKLTVAGRRLLVERELEQARLAARTRPPWKGSCGMSSNSVSASAADGP